MSDQIQTIRRIIDEHKSIEEQIRQALGLLEDWQISLESTIANGEAAQVESLSGKQWSLVRAIGSLEEGMLDHYQKEEHELLEFIGPIMTKAFRIQYREILEQLRNVRRLLTDTDLKSLSMTELAAKYPNVKKELEYTYRFIGEHGTATDIILHMVLRGILAKGEV